MPGLPAAPDGGALWWDAQVESSERLVLGFLHAAADAGAVVANRVEKLNTWRITFTFPLINHAAEVLYLIAGDDKAEVLRDILEGEKKDAYPTQQVQPVDGKLLWIIEKGAARLLTPR